MNRALEGSIFKLHIQRAFFLTFLAKIVAGGRQRVWYNLKLYHNLIYRVRMTIFVLQEWIMSRQLKDLIFFS